MSVLSTRQMEPSHVPFSSGESIFGSLILCCKQCPDHGVDGLYSHLRVFNTLQPSNNDWVLVRDDGYKLFVPFNRYDLLSCKVDAHIRSGELLFVHLKDVIVRNDSNLVRAYREFIFGGAFND